MSVWSVALDSRKGPVWGQVFWTQESCGLEGVGSIVGAPARLNSRDQQSLNRDGARSSTFGRSQAGASGCLVGDGSCTQTRRQELLWRQFFREPTCWWDNRQAKKTRSAPDFRNDESQEVLWLNSLYKPAWVDGQLAALDMEMGGAAPSLSGCRPGGRGVRGETVSGLCRQGHLSEAVEALAVLVETGCGVSRPLLYAVLKECVGRRDLVLGRRVHALVVKEGYEFDTFLCNHIMRMYAWHGRLQDAMDVFTMVAHPDAFMWSSIISAYVEQGRDEEALELYRGMRRSSVKPDGHVFVAALQACARGGDLKAGQELHADVLAAGVEFDVFVCTCLVDMYAKCGSLEEARRVFEGLEQKNVVTWTALIAGYSQQGMGEEALGLYWAMQAEGIAVPNAVTFLCLLQACASVGTRALEMGKQLHAQIREQGHEDDVFVANSLVNMYAKCGSFEDARRVFDGLGRKDVVTWNAMIAGYSQQGMGQEALCLYNTMLEEGVVAPDAVTFVCLLQACAGMGTLALEQGKELHVQIRERGHRDDVLVANSLVNMYAKCGGLEDAQRVFDGLGEKVVGTWNAMIAGYSHQGMGQKALSLYRAMQDECMALPDSVTFVCLLQACADLAALHLGRQLHAEIEEQCLQADVVVASSLINMYGKCGSMADAQQVFEVLPKRDFVVWSALIAGYTSQGDSEAVFDLVQRMRENGIQPVSVTFLSVLTVCSHASLVEKGREFFEAMHRDYGIAPTVDHYTCMVDLLGRAGRLDEALVLVRTMPVLPNAAIWHTLLSACRKWSSVEVGRLAFDQAVNLDKTDPAPYVLMSNIYTTAQMWEQAQKMQDWRKTSRAWKGPAQSWWTDMDGLVHSFRVGDENFSCFSWDPSD